MGQFVLTGLVCLTNQGDLCNLNGCRRIKLHRVGKNNDQECIKTEEVVVVYTDVEHMQPLELQLHSFPLLFSIITFRVFVLVRSNS